MAINSAAFSLLPIPTGLAPLAFGHVKIAKEQIFAFSRLCFAFVNIKPFAPGHSLVVPKRVVQRYRDLTPEELLDFNSLVQVVSTALEKMHKGTSSSIIIQDGPEAGQTIPHIHTHIIPRSTNDLEDPDSIYSRVDAQEGKLRTLQDMETEALKVREYIDVVVGEKSIGCFK